MNKSKSSQRIRCLVEGAIFVALAQVLGYLKIWSMPNGGSVTLLMLPIFIYAYRWGMGPGLLAGFVLSLLQLFLDRNYTIGWQGIILDFLVAFTLLGFAGIGSGKKGGLFWGACIGAVLRFLSHYIAGATIWAEWMPDKFIGIPMTSPWIYSALYNGIPVGLSLAAALAVLAILAKPLKKYLAKQN